MTEESETRGPARSDTRVVVVGAGIAAVRTVARLRRQGFAGRITVLGAEVHPPYDRPPLSKAVLRGDTATAALRFDAGGLDVDLRLGVRVEALDTANRTVAAGGRRYPYDKLVVATGAEPVRLPGPGPQTTLRTLDDALLLRDRLRSGLRLTIVGASWIGAEVATVARARGCRVVCVETGAAPLAQAVGVDVGRRLLPWWDGVDLRLQARVHAVTVEGVELEDGTAVPSDLVVCGVGVRPVTDWLEGSGVALDRGVLVDEHLRASAPGVVALGDVAARWSPRFAGRLRLGHWDDAASAGQTAAGTLLAAPDAELPVHDPVPYFWSDQFGHRLQYVGHRRPGNRLQPAAGEDEDGPGATYRWTDEDDRLSAVLAVDRPRESAAALAALSGPVPATAPAAGAVRALSPTTSGVL